jgi:hypothetical protein
MTFMTSIKISTLPAGTMLGGGERLLAVQDGGNVAITPAQIAAYAQTGSQGKAYTGPVAARGAVPNVTSTTNKSAQDMTVYFATDDILSSKLLFMNAYVDGGGGGGTFVETAPAGTVSRQASIEPVIGGASYQYRFGGAATGSAATGGLVAADWLTHPSIKAGNPFRTRNRHTGSANCFVGLQQLKSLPGEGFEPAAATTDKTMSGTIPAATGNCRSPPVAVLGMTRKDTLLLLSNCRGRGVGDKLDGRGLAGAIERSLAGIAVLKASTGGDAVVNYLASHGLRQQLAAYCSHVIGFDLINDINARNRTSALALADLASFVALFGTQPVYLPTLQACTTSTDGYATLAGQTVATSAIETNRQDCNAAIRGYAVSGMRGIVDASMPVEDMATGKWLPGKTADGLHERLMGALAVVAQATIRPAILTR